MAANWTNAQVIAQLNSGNRWTGSTISYAFPSTPSGLYSAGEAYTFVAVNTTQKVVFTLAIQTWDDLIAPTMSLTTGASNIEFGFTSSNIDYAHAYQPNAGSAWFRTGSDVSTASVDTYGFATIMHELGHTLGLNHMGNYNGSGAATPSSYQDSRVLSIMSYYGPDTGRTSSQVMGADWIAVNGQDYSPQTPMLNDVLAIQSIYGASTTTRTDNTVYGFGSTISGNMAAIFNFNLNPYPILTLYDSAGIDTLNLSGWNSASTVSLESGVYSSCNYMTNNIVIAYGCVIENAIGGGGNDVLTGNSSANRLEGGAGNDTLAGGTGNDTLDGGAGDDTAIFSGSFSSYAISLNAATGVVTLSNAASGSDSASNIEIFQFADGSRAVGQLTSSTDLAAPILNSRSPSDESVNVAVGANIVLTFNETVRAGSGNIVITDLTTGATRTIAASDTSQVSFSGSNVTINPASDLAAGHRFDVTLGSGVIKDVAGNNYAGLSAGALNFNTAAVTALDAIAGTTATSATLPIGTTGASSIDTVADQDWWRISLNAGNSYTFRLNKTAASTLDAYLRLLDANGTVLLVNDDGAGNNDSLITYRATSSGTYYLSAQSFNNGSSGAYTLSASTLADTVAPTLTGRSPSDETTNVAVGANIVLTFSETVRAGSGNIVLTDLTTGATRVIAASDSSQVSFSGNNVTINPMNDLAAGHRFDVTLASGVIKDTTGNNYAGLGAGSLNFNTAAATATDTIAATTATSAILQVGIAGSSTLDTAADQDWWRVSLNAGTAYAFTLQNTQSGSLLDPYLRLLDASGRELLSNDDSGGGSTSLINYTPTTSGTYYLSAQSFLGISSGAYALLARTAGDTTAPTLTGRSPFDETTNVAVGANIVLIFSETVRAGSGNIVLADLSTGAARAIAITDTSQVSFAGNAVTINLASDLAAGHRFDVTLASGVIKDAVGNSYAGLSSGALNFTTVAGAPLDTILGTTATTATLSIGTAGTSTIDTVSDQDWWRISLNAGTTYAFRLQNVQPGSLDPYLRLLDASGRELLANDDGGGGSASLINYTPTTGGTYYLSAQAFVGMSTGAYALYAAHGSNNTASSNNMLPFDADGSGAQALQLLTLTGRPAWFAGELEAADFA